MHRASALTASSGIHGNPYARAHPHGMPVEFEGFLEQLDQRQAHILGILAAGRLLQDDRENSSPPVRATVSERRTRVRNTSPTRFSSKSPTWWPTVSFTCLKRSRSISSSAAWPPVRCARSSAPASRSWKSRRLGSPVSSIVQRQILVVLDLVFQQQQDHAHGDHIFGQVPHFALRMKAREEALHAAARRQRPRPRPEIPQW